MAENILEVRHLKKYFKTGSGMLHAVDDISFDLQEGRTLGLVGESGCGKSTTGRSILRLIEPTSGEIVFQGKDITKLSKGQMRHVRKDMQIIFQDPFSSLDPKKTINQIISEPIRVNRILTDKHAIEDRVLELMETVGLAERLINSYPHVSIQAQILNLLKTLQEKMHLTYIFITHDLSVVNHFSDEIAVMYLGSIVEKAPAEELFNNPIHPYTRALLSAIPVPDLSHKRQRISLKGEITSPVNLPEECRFANRCFECNEFCRKGIPQLKEVSPNHFVACFTHG